MQNKTNLPKPERIAKRIARAGICSRRDAEKLILEGRVMVDDQILTTPAFVVGETSVICIDGKKLAEAERVKLWRFYKPKNILTTAKDPRGRPTIYELLPKQLPRVVTVGRLDFTTEGLLLLTNDGGLARHLELPKNAWIRKYRVRVHGEINPDKIKELEAGVVVSGIRYQPAKVVIEHQKNSNSWLNVSVKEGKNREVRNLMEYAGLEVNRLIRVAFGPFQLGHLKEGELVEVPGKVLEEQLGHILTGL